MIPKEFIITGIVGLILLILILGLLIFVISTAKSAIKTLRGRQSDETLAIDIAATIFFSIIILFIIGMVVVIKM